MQTLRELSCQFVPELLAVLADSFLIFLPNPYHKDSAFLGNDSKFLPDCTVSCPRRWNCSKEFYTDETRPVYGCRDQ
jgi:hypothetical protein